MLCDTLIQIVSDGMSYEWMLFVGSFRRTRQLFLLSLRIEDNTIVFVLEPFHCVVLCETVRMADLSALTSSLSDVVSCKKEVRNHK